MVNWACFAPPLSWYPQVRLLHAPNWTLVKLALDPIGITKPPAGLPMASAGPPCAAVTARTEAAARIVKAVTRRMEPSLLSPLGTRVTLNRDPFTAHQNGCSTHVSKRGRNAFPA